MTHPNDDVILDKLRRSLKGNTPKTGIRGNWFTGAECVRLLEMLDAPRESVRRKMPTPGGTITIGDELTLTIKFSAGFVMRVGEVFDLYRRDNGPTT